MASSTPEPEGSAKNTAEETPEDEERRKFREALERKRDKHGGKHDDDVKGGGKVRDKHEPAARRRTFRRKSG